jgi:hypothetical protein
MPWFYPGKTIENIEVLNIHAQTQCRKEPEMGAFCESMRQRVHTIDTFGTVLESSKVAARYGRRAP